MTRRYSAAENLTSSHDTQDFDCGSEAQNGWLKHIALQAMASDTAQVYVVRRLSDNRVVAYYSLSATSVEPEGVTARIRKGLGRLPAVPAILLGRLGVDLSEQGKGLGAALVKDALLTAEKAASIIGARCLLLHAETDRAREFYLRIVPSFEDGPDPLQLMLLMKDLRLTLGKPKPG